MNHPKRIVEAYGPHLIIDGFGCDHDALVNMDLIYDFLDRAPDLVGMTKIMPPHVVKYGSKPGLHEAGISGFVLIAESHISVHTWPEYLQVQLDWFSCKDFDAEKAINHSKEAFRIGYCKTFLFDRGLEFPRDIPQVADYLAMERRAGWKP